jgi:hypothetical protein
VVVLLGGASSEVPVRKIFCDPLTDGCTEGILMGWRGNAAEQTELIDN